ncbi:MAG TPA: hypothetical protein VLK84_26320, partial [Longimicrobium sp.]|nr:hypothetical protein [Longimicrobium sp.]
RTRRYMAVVWLGCLALEAVVLVLANRTNNSWFLVLAAALLIIPIAAMDATWRWFSREPRKRWKRHDLEGGLPSDGPYAGAAPPSAPRDAVPASVSPLAAPPAS